MPFVVTKIWENCSKIYKSQCCYCSWHFFALIEEQRFSWWFWLPSTSLAGAGFVKLCHHHCAFSCAIDTHHTIIIILKNSPLFSLLTKMTKRRFPAQFSSLTSEPRRTQTGEVAHSVLTGGAVPAGLWGTLIHVNLAVGALETRHAEARVAVPTCSAYGAVLARVRRALVLCGGWPVRRDT